MMKMAQNDEHVYVFPNFLLSLDPGLSLPAAASVYFRILLLMDAGHCLKDK
jgi:hypothetical protein